MALGRPEKFPIKKLIRFDQSMLNEVDDFRRQQHPIPAESEAIRTLVGLGLEYAKIRKNGRQAVKRAEPRKKESE